MRVGYFDCFCGVSGDMVLSAMVDSGVDGDGLNQAVGALPIEGYELAIARVHKSGFAATQCTVTLDANEKQPHRHLKDVRKIIEGSSLSDGVKRRAVAVFERLAKAEAAVHGSSIEKVHFHEVGAVDAIIDIVGACWCVERLGLEHMVCSPIPPGSGTVTCAHGTLPVPAPATALLLKGVPLAACDVVGELVTPTGAALMTEFADAFGTMPAMKMEHIGLGAGQREVEGRPNVLRLIVGESLEAAGSDRVCVLEANLDDATPEVVGYALERLMDAGALDAFCVPIQMKKSRPGVMLTVLAAPERAAELESIVFSETTTFGVRRTEATRSVLSRRVETVETRYGAIGVKVGTRGGSDTVVSPEYADCRDAASRNEVPLRVVMAEAAAAWRQRNP